MSWTWTTSNIRTSSFLVQHHPSRSTDGRSARIMMRPSVLPLRQRKVRKSSVFGLRLERSWMEEDSDEDESDDRDEDGTVARLVLRLPGSATLMGVVLGELGCDWANFL